MPADTMASLRRFPVKLLQPYTLPYFACLLHSAPSSSSSSSSSFLSSHLSLLQPSTAGNGHGKSDVSQKLVHQASLPHLHNEDGSLERINLLLEQGLSMEQVNSFLLKCTLLYGHRYFLHIPIAQVHSMVAFFKTVHIEKQNLGKLLLREPKILRRRIDGLKSKVSLLQDLGIAPNEVGKCVLKRPRNFLLSVDSLKQRIQFWQSLGSSNEFICRMIRSNPDALGLSLQYVSQKMRFLEQQLGFERNSKELMLAYCKIGSCHSECLQSRLHRLTTWGFSSAETKKLARKCPTILSLNPENWEKKVEYISIVLKRDVEDILSFPQYLTCSLEKRIKPRFAVLADRQGEYSLTINSPLSCILSCSDAVFQKKLLIKKKRKIVAPVS